MNKINQEIDRIKSMMKYGLQNENKSYNNLEYNKLGADGKMYGIVREGTKYYIKVSNNTKNVIKENFDYIDGFVNRKKYEYDSYANALKHFELKMHSLNEANRNKVIVESWNPDKKEMLAIEATEKMKKEIARQKQIMSNSRSIMENKNYTVSLDEESCCSKVDKECADTQKDNIKKVKRGTGSQLGTKGDPFNKKTKSVKNNVKKEFNPVVAENEVLGWNDNKDYLDTSNSTNIGKSSPFDKCACSKENCDCEINEDSTLFNNGECQNTPNVGTSKQGDTAPFTKKVNEDIENDDNLESNDDNSYSGDENYDFDNENPEENYENSEDAEFDDENPEEDYEDVEFDDENPEEDYEDVESNDDLSDRLNNIENILDKISDKLGIDNFDDEPLYDDDSENFDDSEDDFDSEDDYDGEDDFDGEDDYDGEDDFDNDDENSDEEVYESKNYRKMMMEDEMNYFGKHPAYQKSPVKLPSDRHSEKNGYYDMNDDSVYGEQPYGKEIGDSKPFEISSKKIENAIEEAIKRLKKKI